MSVELESILSVVEGVCKLNGYDFSLFSAALKNADPSTDTDISPDTSLGSAKVLEHPQKKAKRPRSAYIFFCQENRPIVKERLGAGARATEVTSKLGKLWRELKADPSRKDELLRYHDLSNEEKLHSTTDVYEKPKACTAGPRKKFIKRVTGYDVYCRETKDSVVAQNPKLKAGSLAKFMAKAWKGMSDQERQKWKDLAALEWQPGSKKDGVEGRDPPSFV